MSIRTVTSVILIGSFLAVSQAYAGDEQIRRVTFLDVKKPTVKQVDEALFPADVIALKKECREMEKAGFRCQSVVPKSSLDSVQVTFARGSAELTKDAKVFLKAVGESLKKNSDEWKSVSIEGHTDATGTDATNQELSVRRAEAVKAYFATNFALTKIETIGRGSEKLRDQEDPTAEVNRRIEFVTNW